MTPVVCEHCGREQLPHENPAPLCGPCTGDLRRRCRDTLQVILVLRDTQALVARVEPDTTRGTAGRDPDGRTLDHRYPQTAAATRSPLFEPAGDRIRDLRRTVEAWAQRTALLVVPRLCAHESCHHARRPWCQQADDRARATDGLDRDAGRWLADRVEHVVRRQPWAADCARDVERAHRQALAMVDRPAEVFYAGPCDALVDTPHGPDDDDPALVRCGHDLYARLDAPVVRCRYCGTEHDVAERRDRLLDSAGDLQLTAVDASRALTSLDAPVTADLIRQWRHRGILDASGVTPEGRPTYRLRDVRAALNRHTYGTVRTTP